MFRSPLFVVALLVAVYSACGAPVGVTSKSHAAVDEITKADNEQYEKIIESLFSHSRSILSTEVRDLIYGENAQRAMHSLEKMQAEPAAKGHELKALRREATVYQLNDILKHLNTKASIKTESTYLKKISAAFKEHSKTLSVREKLYFNLYLRFARLRNWWSSRFGKGRSDVEFPKETPPAVEEEPPIDSKKEKQPEPWTYSSPSTWPVFRKAEPTTTAPATEKPWSYLNPRQWPYFASEEKTPDAETVEQRKLIIDDKNGQFDPELPESKRKNSADDEATTPEKDSVVNLHDSAKSKGDGDAGTSKGHDGN